MEPSYHSKILITRPADTNAYTGGDVVGPSSSTGGAILEFPLINSVNGSGHIIITDLNFRVDVSAVPSGMTNFRLHLYRIPPPSALADNAAWDLTAVDRESYFDYIDVGTPVDVGSTLYVRTSGINLKLYLANLTSMFGYLVTNGGYTPTSGATKMLRLNALPGF